MNNIKYLTVTALNRYVSYKFEQDQHLSKLYVKGEISNLRPSGGHLYFSLKDENSQISAVIFKNNISKLKFQPTDGMTVLVEASLGVYQKKGTYNLTISQMANVGLGEAYLNFIQLKEKLSKEGLFDEKFKLELPEYCEKVGVITSSTGDALHDITSTISKRFPLATIYLYPALVQGVDAPRDLIRALNLAYKNDELDCIIIGRGGGSIEDLSAFNDEQLARTIFRSPIPIVSAVGHEADYTICDFVSSFRAPTPTGAAVRVSKDKYNILSELDNTERHLKQLINQKIEKLTYKYKETVSHYAFKNFIDKIDRRLIDINNLEYTLGMLSPLSTIKFSENKVNDLTKRLELIDLESKINDYNNLVTTNIDRMNSLTLRTINEKDNSLNTIIEKMILVNPMNILKKGYTLTYQNDKLITSVDNVENKDISVKFFDGIIKATVTEVIKNKE